ncbi:ABC transporter ATP-binding protein [Bacillus carboniphilus]|uniref:ABC transporter ATP-binding protein n=1 Tax=Bacillus carboniphilus TaxID=86663 RepID=A0ABY9JSJ0_9BACI|nr:ABC transporter ATP-binding protein [Bacillus carboniphilus]WLR41223.1 ABC transporter ATP-binding protein [Bacillus carboniphilus]
MIEISQLSKKYRTGKIGFQPFTYQVPLGQCVALLGGNGAGKSTFLKLLTNNIRPTTGQVNWGEDQFAYMPDDLEFPANLTAIEAIKLLGTLKKVDSKKCNSLLKEVGLYEVRNERINTYSKGMKQRLSFVQTLLSDEKVLLLDEPTNGLDPYWVKWLKNRLLEEKSKGKTIVFSTHTLSFVEELADEVLFFYEGKVILQDNVKSLLQESRSLEDVIVEKIEKLIMKKD